MLLNDLPYIMIRCAVGTVLIEGIAAFILGIRTLRGQIIAALANTMTNPVLVATTVTVRLFYGKTAYNVVLILMEIAAVLVEALVYRLVMKLGAGDGEKRDASGKRFALFIGGDVKTAIKPMPLILSLILNCCSYFGGEIINRLIY